MSHTGLGFLPLTSSRCFSPSETNLKVKQALTVTGEMGDGIDELAGFKGGKLDEAVFDIL